MRALRAERLLSLDAFRGITISAMILVNNAGDWDHVHWPLEHAAWNGWTPTDLIFPFFLFIVGVAIALSFADRTDRSGNRWQLFAKVARRTLVLFGLGIILNGFPRFDWSALRIPGVLQRIAACYFFGSTAVLTMGVGAQAITTALILIGYWAALMLVPIAGQLGGALSPDTNLAALVDDALLHGHLLHGNWDPEGILSTLPAVATTLTGVLTGYWLRRSMSPSKRLVGLVAAGSIALVLGEVMNVWFPINKSLWTSSFVVFSSGMALTVLALCYWLIDSRGYRGWAKPFLIYGTNPIVAYVFSSLVAKVMLLWDVVRPDGAKVHLQQYLFEAVFLPLASPVNASLCYALSYVLLWLGITALLYRKGVVIKM